MSILRDDVVKIAHLARLELKEDRVDSYTNALNQILGHVDELKALNTDDVPATFSVTPQSQTLRDDTTVQTSQEFRGEILSQAPDVEDTFFAVPQIIE